MHFRTLSGPVGHARSFSARFLLVPACIGLATTCLFPLACDSGDSDYITTGPEQSANTGSASTGTGSFDKSDIDEERNPSTKQFSGMILFNKSSFSGTSQGEPAKTSLWMIDPNGGEPIQIQTRIETDAKQVHAYMSKNCARMAVPDDTRYGGDNRPYTMDLMNLDGSNRSSISVPGFTKLTPTWSQDGSMLAYISRDQSAAGTRSTGASGTQSQAILNILDGNGGQLRSFPLAVYPMGDTPWSPDKSHLVLVAEDKNSVNVRDIYIVNTETGQLRNVTHDKAAGVERITERPWAPAWSPDSQKLAYIDSSLDYGNSIRLLDLSTGSDTLIWSPDRNWRNSSLGGVAWSPDGSHIAFSTSWDEPDQFIGNHMEDLWLMRSDGSDAHILFQGPDIDKLAGWCLCDDFPSVLGVPEGRLEDETFQRD